jgi:hypothetical protein
MSRKLKAALIAVGAALGIFTVSVVLIYICTSFGLWLIGGE